MGKQKSDDKKKKKKSSQLVIRIDEEERNAFVKLCDVMDTSAAREIRVFMRDWVTAHALKPDTGDALAAPIAEGTGEAEPDAKAEVEPAARSNRKHLEKATA